MNLNKISISPFIVLLILYSWYFNRLKELIIIFGVISIHELGHIALAKYYKLRINHVFISPMGLMAEINFAHSLDYKKEIVINLAGPIANIIMIVIGFLLNSLFFGQSKNMSFFILVNVSLFTLNILPVLPLDGGKTFRRLLFYKFGYRKTRSIFNFFNSFFTILIIIIGIFQMYICHYNFSLILIGLFIYLYKAKNVDLNFNLISHLIYKREKIQKIKVYKALYIVAYEECKALDIIKDFYENKFNIIKVINSNGKVEGEITEYDVLDVLIKYDCNVTIKECLEFDEIDAKK